MMPPQIRCYDDDNDVDGAVIADAMEKSVRACVHLSVNSQTCCRHTLLLVSSVSLGQSMQY
jgi:hypothetical protein